jgi:hypothetical protein
MNMFKPTKAKTVDAYIRSIDEPRRAEVEKVDQLIRESAPDLKRYFAYNMIGYGEFHYKSKSGREGDWPVIALASQKNYISVYVCVADSKGYLPEQRAAQLGKVSVGKSCIRFKQLSDIDQKAFASIISEAEEWYKSGKTAF